MISADLVCSLLTCSCVSCRLKYLGRFLLDLLELQTFLLLRRLIPLALLSFSVATTGHNLYASAQQRPHLLYLHLCFRNFDTLAFFLPLLWLFQFYFVPVPLYSSFVEYWFKNTFFRTSLWYEDLSKVAEGTKKKDKILTTSLKHANATVLPHWCLCFEKWLHVKLVNVCLFILGVVFFTYIVPSTISVEMLWILKADRNVDVLFVLSY